MTARMTSWNSSDGGTVADLAKVRVMLEWTDDDGSHHVVTGSGFITLTQRYTMHELDPTFRGGIIHSFPIADAGMEITGHISQVEIRQ